MAESTNLFPREERLRKRKEFLRVYEKGAKFKTRLFFLYLLENGLSHSRIGITVSRKVGKTNIRNQVKRRLKEIFRKNKNIVKTPCDLVVNTSVVTARARYAQLEEEFRKVFLHKDGGKEECDN